MVNENRIEVMKTYKEQNLKPLELSEFRPIRDNVIVSDMEFTERLSQGGIIIPDTAQEKTQTGKVAATGEGKLNSDGTIRDLRVKAQDTVLFGKYAGTEIKIDGK